MRGTIRKNNCLRAFFDNVRDGRVGPMAPAPFATMIESHKVRPAALRALGTERAYSLTDDEFEEASIPTASVPLLRQFCAPFGAALLGL